MILLLAWPTYGHWFTGHGRGHLELRHEDVADGLPEPTGGGEVPRPPRSPWPSRTLGTGEQRTVLADLDRIARLRGFTVHAAVVGPTSVQVLIETEATDPTDRLVQLVKGALARALTVAAGDPRPETAGGTALPHHKWWTRQHACLVIADDDLLARVRRALEHRGRQPGCVAFVPCRAACPPRAD